MFADEGTNAEATRTCIGVFHTRHRATSSRCPALRYPRLSYWETDCFFVLSSTPISSTPPLAEPRATHSEVPLPTLCEV